MSKGETWRDVPGTDGRYSVSDQGRVWSRPRQGTAGGELRQQVRVDGYLQVNVGGRWVKTHRLVALTFHGAPEPGEVVRHRNGDRSDNRAENLRWGTSSENTLDSVKHGTHYSATRTHCPHGHEYTPTNTSVRRGKRTCKTCHNERSRRRRRGTKDQEATS